MGKRSSGAHFKTPDDAGAAGGHASPARHTRDSLEGATATPLDAAPVEGLSSGAERLDPTVRRPVRHHDQIADRFQEDLEPQTRASRHAVGTASLITPAGGSGGAGGTGFGGNGRDEGPAPKKRRVPLPVKVLIVLLALILIVCGALAAWVASLQSSMSLKEEDRVQLQEALVAPEAQDEPFYALIIGSDARANDTVSRADVIMLARVDTANGKIALVSIPRDTMISLGGDDVQKINAFYNYGPAPLVNAVSEFAGVDIAHYVEVDFAGVEEVVDALGGVTVTIPEDIPSGNGGYAFTKGEQTLNGEQALAYARERYNVSGGDFGRARAQRQIVTAIVQEVLASGPTEMPFLITKLAESISTDLSVPDIIGYALDISDAGSTTIYSAIAPSYAYNVGGVSYVATMYDEWRELMQRTDAGLDPNDESAEIPEEQKSDEALGAAPNGGGPRDYQDIVDNSSFTTDLVKPVEGE